MKDAELQLLGGSYRRACTLRLDHLKDHDALARHNSELPLSKPVISTMLAAKSRASSECGIKSCRDRHNRARYQRSAGPSGKSGLKIPCLRTSRAPIVR